tara:strand:+ start:143 stop:967 length:825 start_codon:yes stop_codon:yes gene_type:complete
MTNPEARGDPWKEALNCYNDVADEVIVVGDNWPYDFSWDHIGKTFQEGYDKCSSDWIIRMDIDYFFHQKDIPNLRKALLKYANYPALAFPQYQIFTPDRYQIKTRICLAFNKRIYKNIKLNGGGDLTLATLDNKLIDPKKVPNVNIPIYQYESTFRTKEIIKSDRARFAKAWINYFGTVDDRGGDSPEEAYNAWFKMVKERYPKHNFKLKIEEHPIYVQNKIKELNQMQFGYDAFGLKNNLKIDYIYHLKGMREKYFNPIQLRKYKRINYYDSL